jgi:hypothetical protein
VNAFVLGSELYHDYYRWPMKDRRTFEEWQRESSWGRLFEAYARGESRRIMSAESASASPV